CKGIFIQSEGMVTSPGYPNKYTADNYCKQIIHAPPNSVIAIHFTKLDLGRDNMCNSDYLQINNGDKTAKYCGSGLPEDIFISTERLEILFVSSSIPLGTGFAFWYETSAEN
ncbi:hypothetical protein CAPTEDRAFT_66427, partial [Capitella teleta]